MNGERVFIPKGNPETIEYTEDPWNYRHLMKDLCFICNKEFRNKWSHYRTHGNCCLQCSHDTVNAMNEHKNSDKVAEMMEYLKKYKK